MTEVEVSSGFVTLTQEKIFAGGNAVGAGYSWNKRQLAVLGVSWPLKSGWKGRLCGRVVTAEVYREFLRLKTDLALATADDTLPDGADDHLRSILRAASLPLSGNS